MLIDSERATAWNFEHLLPLPATARYVRYQISPRRSVCVSELQVFDRIDYGRSTCGSRCRRPRPRHHLHLHLHLHLRLRRRPVDAVVLASPAGGATVSGTTVVSASTTGGPFTSVMFYASGMPIGTATGDPYAIDWNTTSVPNGTIALTATATTTSGEVVTSPATTVTVENVARAVPRAGWVATASHKTSVASRTIDDSPATRWDTGATQTIGQWFQIDMGVPTTFDRVVVDAGTSKGGYPRGYRVSVSNDGVAWVDVAAGTGNGPIVDVRIERPVWSAGARRVSLFAGARPTSYDTPPPSTLYRFTRFCCSARRIPTSACRAAKSARCATSTPR